MTGAEGSYGGGEGVMKRRPQGLPKGGQEVPGQRHGRGRGGTSRQCGAWALSRGIHAARAARPGVLKQVRGADGRRQKARWRAGASCALLPLRQAASPRAAPPHNSASRLLRNICLVFSREGSRPSRFALVSAASRAPCVSCVARCPQIQRHGRGAGGRRACRRHGMLAQAG